MHTTTSLQICRYVSSQCLNVILLYLSLSQLQAKIRQDDQFKAPKQHISNPEELAMHKLSKRKEFEDSIRRQRMHVGTWIKVSSYNQ